MSRVVYFGPRIDFARNTVVPPEPGRVIPTFTLEDPDGDLIVVKAVIPDYGDESLDLREIHVFVLPADYVLGEPHELLTLSESQAAQDRIDVTNVRGEVTLAINAVALADGQYFAQPVLVAGTD